MAKIFEFNQGQKGTLIDSVSKTAGINVGNSFAKTEKGIAYRALQSNAGQITYAAEDITALNFGNNPFTIAIAFKMGKWKNNGSSYNSLFGGKADVTGVTKGITAYYTSAQVLTFTWGTGSLIASLLLDDFGSLYDGKFHLALLTFDGITYKAYLDNIKETTESTIKHSIAFDNFYIGAEEYTPQRRCNSDILFIKAYNHNLSTQERTALYEQFLQASPTEKPVRGFEYPKPTDLSYENGLVAAYSFSPETVSNGTLIDISGNGNNGTINGALLTKDGMQFSKAGVNIQLSSDYLLPSTCTIAFKGYISGTQYVLSRNTSGFLLLSLSPTGISIHDGTGLNILSFTTQNTIYSDYVLSISGTSCIVYCNGSQVYSGTLSRPFAGILRQIGSSYLSVTPLNYLNDLKIYNYAFTPAEAKAYHNSFIKPYLLENLSNHPVSDTSPKGWIKGTGAYKISESVDKGKYLECTTAGTTAIQSKQAYGEWEFDVYKGADGNALSFNFISVSTALPVAGIDSGVYRVLINVNEALSVYRSFNSLTLLSTANSYISNNTWYRIKVARLQSEGVFKDIPTLQTSNLVQDVSYPYTSFTSNGRYGYTAISDGSGVKIAGTVQQIPIVNGAKYLIECNIGLISGTAPTVRLSTTLTAGTSSNIIQLANGKNSVILTANVSTPGTISFYNSPTATNFTLSGLTIRRIYPANSFAVFIKGGAYGNTETGWTLVSTAGGSGSNPVTDSTYTTSEYFVTDLDAGDKIANIKLLNGVKQ